MSNSFHKKLRHNNVVGTVVGSYRKHVTDGNNIRVMSVSADDAYPELPTPDNFTLDAQLKAGVNLTEVNSVLLDESQRKQDEHLAEFVSDINKLDETSTVE